MELRADHTARELARSREAAEAAAASAQRRAFEQDRDISEANAEKQKLYEVSRRGDGLLGQPQHAYPFMPACRSVWTCGARCPSCPTGSGRQRTAGEGEASCCVARRTPRSAGWCKSSRRCRICWISSPCRPAQSHRLTVRPTFAGRGGSPAAVQRGRVPGGRQGCPVRQVARGGRGIGGENPAADAARPGDRAAAARRCGEPRGAHGGNGGGACGPGAGRGGAQGAALGAGREGPGGRRSAFVASNGAPAPLSEPGCLVQELRQRLQEAERRARALEMDAEAWTEERRDLMLRLDRAGLEGNRVERDRDLLQLKCDNLEKQLRALEEQAKVLAVESAGGFGARGRRAAGAARRRKLLDLSDGE